METQRKKEAKTQEAIATGAHFLSQSLKVMEPWLRESRDALSAFAAPPTKVPLAPRPTPEAKPHQMLGPKRPSSMRAWATGMRAMVAGTAPPNEERIAPIHSIVSAAKSSPLQITPFTGVINQSSNPEASIPPITIKRPARKRRTSHPTLRHLRSQGQKAKVAPKTATNPGFRPK